VSRRSPSTKPPAGWSRSTRSTCSPSRSTASTASAGTEIAADQSQTRPSRPKFARRRRQILDAAAQVFYEKGYEATSTRDIADAAGLLKGSLYYYVDSKEDFLYEISRATHAGALATVDRVRQVDGDALARLAALVREHLHYFVENRINATVYLREFRVLSPERQAVIAADGDSYLDYVRELLTEGQRDGLVALDLDVRLVSIGLVGMINSAWLWYQPNGALTSDEIADEFAKLVVAGVASDAAVAAAGSPSRLRRSLTSGR
jgi:AcrR family transcriptional regulator